MILPIVVAYILQKLPPKVKALSGTTSHGPYARYVWLVTFWA